MGPPFSLFICLGVGVRLCLVLRYDYIIVLQLQMVYKVLVQDKFVS